MKSTLRLMVVLLVSNLGFAQEKEQIVEDETIICHFPPLDQKADFPGGFQNLNKIIKSEIGRKKIIGKTFSFKFTIGKDGKTKNIEVLNNKDLFKTKHIKKVIESLPKWHPATENQKPVESKVVAEIKF